MVVAVIGGSARVGVGVECRNMYGCSCPLSHILSRSLFALSLSCSLSCFLSHALFSLSLLLILSYSLSLPHALRHALARSNSRSRSLDLSHPLAVPFSLRCLIMATVSILHKGTELKTSEVVLLQMLSVL